MLNFWIISAFDPTPVDHTRSMRFMGIADAVLARGHRVTYFSSEYEGLIKGYDNLVKHHEGFGFVDGGKDTGSKLWLEDVEIEEFDDMVLVKADWLFLRKDAETPQKGPVTMVYIMYGDEYKIAHCHFSNY